MKKPKHPTGWEEPSADSSKEINAVLDDLGGLDDLDDEIIDLEDVVESYSEEGMEDDDAFASDVEILDVKESIGLRGFEGKAESDDEFLVEDDLLKELPFFHDEKAEPEPDQREDFMAEEMEELAPGLFGDIGEEAVEGSGSQTGGVVPEELEPEVFVLPVAAPDVEEPELQLSPLPIEPSVPEEAQPEAFVTAVAEPIIEEPDPEVSAPPVAASAEVGVSLDDFVARIENKLVDTIREIVEARLPEIVRMVLREEIAKLKSDQDPGD